MTVNLQFSMSGAITVVVTFVGAGEQGFLPVDREPPDLFGPGICWSGLRLKRSGSFVQHLQM